jgi:hypothetical protein
MKSFVRRQELKFLSLPMQSTAQIAVFAAASSMPGRGIWKVARWVFGLATVAALASCQSSGGVTGPSVSLTSAASVVDIGSGTSLILKSTAATECVGTSGIEGPQPTNGTITVPLITATTTYAVTCTGPSGASTAKAQVQARRSAPSVTLTAAATTIASGTETTLTWSAKGAKSCIASNSNGWSGRLHTEGSQSTGPLTSTTEYTLECPGWGNSGTPATQSVTVTVTGTPPAVQLTATPSTTVAGSPVTLNYSASDATTCTASGGGWSATPALPSGSVNTAPVTAKTTYSLACTGPGGSASQSATVSVTQPVPTVSISAIASTIPKNTGTTISWSSANATACAASGAWSGSQSLSGSIPTGNLASGQTYTLNCTGAGGTATQSATVTVSAGAPTVTFSAGPSAITSGGSSTLSWTATNATSCTAGGGWSGTKAVSGSASTGALTATTTYTLSCTGTGGNASQSATVSVSTPAPTVTIAASPSTVASGSASTVTWSSTNATSCTASGGRSGSEAVSGSASTGALTAKTTYTLACTGAGGSASQSATVSVNSAAPVVTISASPTTVTSGKASTLTWSATNATSCTGSNGWTGTEPTSGSQPTPVLSATTQFVISCTGAGGSASNSATVSVDSTPPTISLRTSPNSVASGGSSTLSWSSINATSCTGSGGKLAGTLATAGTQSTGALSASTTYTVTCTGAGGNASQSAPVTVSAPAPTVTISASPSTVASGASSTVTWSSTNASSCTASGAGSGAEATSGTQSTGALTATSTYTLSCTGTGGTTQQSATVTVSQSTGTTAGPTCTATSGPLTLNAQVSRASGISPLLVFYDATATTDSSLAANMTPFQDVIYTWNFGDTGASGTSTWAYGSNPGNNSRNTATGGIAAHLYVTNGTTTSYTTTVTATDGTNTASCTLAATAYDPTDATNGFAGTATTCVYSDGSVGSGCPSGAATLSTSSFNTALSSPYFGNGKQVLFKCGDTFTGDSASLGATKWSIGAYGGCQGTQTNRPIFNDTTSGNQVIGFANSGTVGDGRIADIDMELNGLPSAGIYNGNFPRISYQITVNNVLVNNGRTGIAFTQGAQWGVVNSVIRNMTTTGGAMAMYFNFNGNNSPYSGNTVNNINYAAALGNSLTGVGSGVNTGAGIETFRISAGRLFVISNNTSKNANPEGAALKIHGSNSSADGATWTGNYEELYEISDNLFTGTSGANLVEIAPQNGGDDERQRNIVVERNLFNGPTVNEGRDIYVTGVNETVRDNVFVLTYGSSANFPTFGAQFVQRGIEPVPQYNEAYNNTCYSPTPQNGQACVGYNSAGGNAPGINSVAMNNLFYAPGSSGLSTVSNGGTGNTVSNNTTLPASNPGFTDGSGLYDLISDFKPTANYSGGASAPALYDALDVPWAPTWNLGAINN